MKREILRVVVLLAVAGTLASGCRTRVVHERVVVTRPGREVIVTEAPPPLRHEVIGVSPSARHVWVEGYWARNHGQWVWVPGHYEMRPRTNAVWVKGHWDRTDRGWVWNPGHWE